MAGYSSFAKALLGEGAFDGTNFQEWETYLRVVLGYERILYTLDRPLEPEPPCSFQKQWDLWKTRRDDSIIAGSIMLTSMTPQLRRQCDGLDPFHMMERLRDMHSSFRLRMDRYEIMKSLSRSQMSENMPIHLHVQDMITYFERLNVLGMPIENELSINFILNSLPNSWDSFVKNYHQQAKDNSLGELLAMLIDAEPEIRKKQEASSVQTSKKAKGKRKLNLEASTDIELPKGRRSSSGKVKDKSQDICLYCRERGHWKRDCPKYKADLEDKRAGKALSEGMFVMVINMSISSY
jgi:hypothetical protein